VCAIQHRLCWEGTARVHGWATWYLLLLLLLHTLRLSLQLCNLRLQGRNCLLLY
jgi:hypothetical protein